MSTDTDKRIAQMMWIIGIAFTVMLGIGGTVAINSGFTKKTAETNAENITKIQRSYVDYIYIEYLVESNQKLINILQATPGTPEMAKAMKEWSVFQDEVMRRANPVRSAPGGGGSNSAEIARAEKEYKRLMTSN